MNPVQAIDLFPGEARLISFKDDSVLLTTHRIWASERDWGSSSSTVVFLEDVASIAEQYTSKFFLLALAILAAGIGCFVEERYQAVAFIVAALSFVAWWLSRRQVVRVSSKGGGRVDLQMSTSEKEIFFKKVLAAKDARISQLFKL